MKISSTTSTRFVTSQEPARKQQVSSPMPLAAAHSAPSKPMAAATAPKFVSTQPAPAPVTYSVPNGRTAVPANDNRTAPKAISAQSDPRKVYETVAHFKLPS